MRLVINTTFTSNIALMSLIYVVSCGSCLPPVFLWSDQIETSNTSPNNNHQPAELQQETLDDPKEPRSTLSYLSYFMKP